jgi:toxin YoeB
MVTWELAFTKHAQKDAKKLAAAGLKSKAEELLNCVKKDPFGKPPPFEKLVGDLKGLHSRRINIQHRLVYEIFTSERKVMIHRMFTHYDN